MGLFKPVINSLISTDRIYIQNVKNIFSILVFIIMGLFKPMINFLIFIDI